MFETGLFYIIGGGIFCNYKLIFMVDMLLVIITPKNHVWCTVFLNINIVPIMMRSWLFSLGLSSIYFHITTRYAGSIFDNVFRKFNGISDFLRRFFKICLPQSFK